MRRVTELTPEQLELAGRVIRILRQQVGWHQRRLAAESGQSGTTVSHAESADRPVAVYRIRAMAAALGHDLDVLLAACGNCAGCPYPGFRCVQCGREGQR